MVTLDTSALIAILDRSDPHHASASATLAGEAGPYIIPVGILAEVAYFIEERLGMVALDAFLYDIESGGYLLDCGEVDIPRVRALVSRYIDLPLGYADAAVIACAERYGGRVITFDLRHFGVVGREGTISIERC